jgi:hypothetical protein
LNTLSSRVVVGVPVLAVAEAPEGLELAQDYQLQREPITP